MKVLFAIFCLLFGAQARAQIFIKPAMMYLQESQQQGDDKSVSSRTLLDIAAGVQTDIGVALGLLYGNEDFRTRVTSSSGISTSTATRTSYGPSVGWVAAKDAIGAFIFGTYFLSSEYKQMSSTYQGGGYQVDLGVRFKLSSVFVGLQMSYKMFEYKKYTTGGASVALTEPIKQGFVDPYFALFFEF